MSEHFIKIVIVGKKPDGETHVYRTGYLYDIGWNGAMAEALTLVNNKCKESFFPEKVTIEHITDRKVFEEDML